MKVYRVTFVRNEPISCKEAHAIELEGTYYYEHVREKIIFAIIKAESENEALELARKLAEKHRERIVGNNIVT